MAIQTTSNLNIQIDWANIDTDNPLATVADFGDVSINITLEHGSGSGEVNKLWHVNVTLPPSGFTGLNLYDLPQVLFNNTVSVSFSGGAIKGIIVKNTNEISGTTVALVATGTNAFTAPFNGNSGVAFIPSTSVACLANPQFGWGVTSTSNRLQILDTSGHGSSVQIAIIGAV